MSTRDKILFQLQINMLPHIDLEKTATLRVGRGVNASHNSNSKPNGFELELINNNLCSTMFRKIKITFGID